MKTQIKKLDRYKRELAIEVGPEVINPKFEDIYTRIAKDVQVPGFRRGKAPREVLEKHYREHAQKQVINELIPEAYEAAVKQETLDVVSCFEIVDVKLENSVLSFKAKLELKPTVEFKKDYKGIKVDYKQIEVGEDEVRRSLDALKESRKVDAIDEKFARGLGYPTLNDLTQTLKWQLYLQKENLQRAKIEEGVVNYLLDNTDFEVPAALINQQLQQLLERQKVELALRGMPEDKIREQEKTLASELEPQAKRQVRVYLVLETIAKKENISLEQEMPQRTIEFLLEQADWQIQKAN